MTAAPHDYRDTNFTSEELIAQAYAAIASYGVQSELPVPATSPVATKASTKAAPIAKGAYLGATSIPVAPKPAVPQAPTPKPAVTSRPAQHQAPVLKPAAAIPAAYLQPVKEQRQASPLSPPPPTGKPIASAQYPLQPVRESGAHDPYTQQSVPPNSKATKSSEEELPRKKSGWLAIVIWLIIILFMLFVLPFLE
ncbi:MAG: hypothetical protein FWD27_01060 [Coriobacteriia bacterium]|nr:hypothetical protein [Coriobacteriia bacterium]